MGNNDRDKLKALLKYWIAHNKDHSEEFRGWAEKAKLMGQSEAADELQKAVKQMDKATALFSQSLKKLAGEGS
jgi:hypothetical protein